MIGFTDKKLYLKGTCQVNLTDPCDGTIVYSSNKFQTGNITTSVTMGEIRAGMGNAVATILPSDSALNVEFTAADFSLWAKAAQLGATLSYGAAAPECVVYEATADGPITIDVSAGRPVPMVGFSDAFAYVQEIGAAGTVGTTGTPYPINYAGLIDGFTARSGKSYRVIYYVSKAGAQIATIGTLFNPRVLHFTAQMPVFSNENCSGTNEGSRVGWLYVIVPRLKLGANGGVVGDQTTADTTSLSGQAVAFDNDVITGCDSCTSGTMAYYIYVPDNGADLISGLAVVGGVVTTPVNTTKQIPVRFVMANGELVVPGSYSNGFSYFYQGAPDLTTVSSSGVINAGSTAGDFEIQIVYENGDKRLSLDIDASVTA